jgi:hypothetical protein
MFKSVHNVIWQAGEEVNHEPAFQVVHSYDFGIRNYFSSRTDKRGVEVEHNVDEEDDVHDAASDGSVRERETGH